MIVIGLTGRKHSGKTTVATRLERRDGFRRMAFADPLKRACVEVFGLDADRLSDPDYKAEPLPEWDGLTPRQILQWTGTELFRERFHELAGWDEATPKVWVRACVNRIEHFLREERRLDGYTGQLLKTAPYAPLGVVVEDCRFDDEADALRSLGGVLVRVDRPSEQYNKDAHASEGGVSAVDHVLYNTGSLKDLNKATSRLVGVLRRKALKEGREG